MKLYKRSHKNMENELKYYAEINSYTPKATLFFLLQTPLKIDLYIKIKIIKSKYKARTLEPPTIIIII